MNEVVIAAAGGGKTTRIVRRALSDRSEKCALITYTQNNVAEIKSKVYHEAGFIPASLEIWPWYTFLLRELARPYQTSLIKGRISGIEWAQGRSAKYVSQSEVSRFYFSSQKKIYSDKLGRFICECNRLSGGSIVNRLEERFHTIYIDEVQDLAGYDLEVLELLLRSKINIILIGDHRQSTYRTNNALKHTSYRGAGIIDKFKEWSQEKLCSLTYENETFRCNQQIADLADSFFPNEPKTVSRNLKTTGHDGVFTIASTQVQQYVAEYRPIVLRLDINTDCSGCPAMNFGQSKGLTFDRVLIFPHKLATKWLQSGDFDHVKGSASKLYVGITRARYSVAFVFDAQAAIPHVIPFKLC
jgi:DNA helicase-2/ATP-dependent DNA helicase PcrA